MGHISVHDILDISFSGNLKSTLMKQIHHISDTFAIVSSRVSVSVTDLHIIEGWASGNGGGLRSLSALLVP